MNESDPRTTEPAPARRRGWHVRWLLPIGLLAAVGVGVGAYLWWPQGPHEAGAQATPPPPPVVTVAKPLVQQLVEWDDFTGRFEPVEQVEVRARVSGYLDAVHFTDGQLVEKGQLLFTIDQRPYQVAVEQAQAAVASAAAGFDQAELELRRAESLRSSPAFQRSNYEDRVQQRLQAQAELNRAKAQLASAMLDLGFTEIRSPVAGRISDRWVDVGNLVGADTRLTSVVSLDPIHFVFDMSETDFLAYQRAAANGTLPSTRDRETAVQVRLVDEREFTREGGMNFVDNVINQGSGTIRGRAEFGNADLLIAPGQFGEIRIPGSPRYEAMLIPESAIVTDQSRKLVMVVGEGNKVEARLVRLGPSELGLRVIRSGLKGDERVIINGLTRARPGAQVTPQEGEIRANGQMVAAGS